MTGMSTAKLRNQCDTQTASGKAFRTDVERMESTGRHVRKPPPAAERFALDVHEKPQIHVDE